MERKRNYVKRQGNGLDKEWKCDDAKDKKQTRNESK
jgi:hypothetical protein